MLDTSDEWIMTRTGIKETKQVKDGNLKSGEAVFDLKSNGVELATTGGKIDDLKAELDKAKTDIVSGKIVVPTK